MSSDPPADATRPAAEPAAAPAGCKRPAALGTSRGLARRQFTAGYVHPPTPSTKRNRDPVLAENHSSPGMGWTPPGRHPSPRAPQSRGGFSAGTGTGAPPSRAFPRSAETPIALAPRDGGSRRREARERPAAPARERGDAAGTGSKVNK